MIVKLKILTVEFGMDPSPLKLYIESFPYYNKEKAFRLIFPHDISLDIFGNLFTTRLTLKDNILHLALCKIILPKVTNLSHINDKELFVLDHQKSTRF